MAILGSGISFLCPYQLNDLISVGGGICIYYTLRMISDTKYRWDTCSIRVEELDNFKKFDGLKSIVRLLLFLKGVIHCTIPLWTLWCTGYCSLGMGWGCSVGCHNDQVMWILLSTFMCLLFV